MITLVLAELRRLRSRRMTWITGLVLLAAVGLFQLAVNSAVSPPSSQDVAQQRQYYEQAHQQWEQTHETDTQQCLASGGSATDCALPEPTPADFSLTATPFAEIVSPALSLAAYVSVLAAFLVSASFIGAEYSTGSLSNWLTFVPERLKVYGSKVVAVVLTSALGGAVTGFAMLGLTALVTRAHGGDLVGLGHAAAVAGRLVPMAGVAGVAGFVFAMLTRHTVAALGIALGYIVASAVLAGLTANADGPFAWLPPWQPEKNLDAFLQHGTSYYQYVETVTASGTTGDGVEKHISFGHSALYWGVLLVVGLVSAALVFRRRDVT